MTRILVLPGYSVHNQEWAEEIKKELGKKNEVMINAWEHWTKGGGLKLKAERKKIIKAVNGKPINIIAKSVGTEVLMRTLPLIEENVQKIILCGVPTVSEENRKVFEGALKNFPSKNIICFQNTKDPFASFAEVEAYMNSIDKGIKVIEKERHDHSYPYFSDFEAFLSS